LTQQDLSAKNSVEKSLASRGLTITVKDSQ
jgi:hypothetical protein